MWRSLLLHTHGAFFSQLLIARGLSFNFNTSIAGWRMDPLKMRFLLIRDFQPAILVYPDVRLMVFFPDVLSHNKLEKMSMLLPAGLFVLWCMTSKTHQKTIEWISQHFRRKCNCLFHTITIKMVEWPLCSFSPLTGFGIHFSSSTMSAWSVSGRILFSGQSKLQFSSLWKTS